VCRYAQATGLTNPSQRPCARTPNFTPDGLETRRPGPGPHTMTTGRSRRVVATSNLNYDVVSLPLSLCGGTRCRVRRLVYIRPILVGHAIDLATAQPPPRTTAKSEPVVDRAGDHADPGHPSRAAACPTAGSTTLLRSDTADAGTHGLWTLRRLHRTPDTGRVDRHAWDTGRSHRHRTPDTGRGHGDQGTAGIRTSPTTTAERPRAGTPDRVPVDGACGARQPHAGSVVSHMPDARLPLALPGSCSLAPPPPKGRLGALLSSNDFGSSVERTAKLHPL
jgi:hypothetical protein